MDNDLYLVILQNQRTILEALEGLTNLNYPQRDRKRMLHILKGRQSTTEDIIKSIDDEI